MQFRDAARGQLFRWHDRLYVKTSPLTATPQDGGKPVMVARSAQVQPAENSVRAHGGKPRPPLCGPEEVREAVDQLYQTALSLLIQHTDSPQSQQALASARDQALAGLQLQATNPSRAR